MERYADKEEKMKTYVKQGSILLDESNGVFYEILSRRNDSLYNARSWILTEHDEQDYIEEGYLTVAEVMRKKIILEGEGPCC